MPFRLNPRVADFVQSDIRAMTRECTRVGGINLSQGICDLPTHPLVQEGAIRAIEESRAIYSPLEGLLDLRKAIAGKMAAYNEMPCDPESEIVVTVGSTGAFAMALLSLLEPSDEVILFEPYYGYHRNTILALGGKPTYVTLHGEAFAIDEQELRRAFTPRTKAIVVCTPSNPCGKVFTRDELSMIADSAIQNDVIAITDEIYEYIVYDSARHISLATIPGMRERTITISGLSKTFSITGWRLGYAVAPAVLARTIGVLSDHFYICAPTPLQYGAVTGLTVGSDYYTDLATSYTRKREMIVNAVRAAGMIPISPQGAYYLLADVSSLGWGDARDSAFRLLRETGVATVPGSAFYEGDDGDRLLRFCFAKQDEDLREAARRLAAL